MSVEAISAHALFDEKFCGGENCDALIPATARLCRRCLIAERKANGQTGAGHPPRGRFEARVLRVALVARVLDQAEAEHRSNPSADTHAALMVAFREFRTIVRLLDRG